MVQNGENYATHKTNLRDKEMARFLVQKGIS
jgi:hypothetical protein